MCYLCQEDLASTLEQKRRRLPNILARLVAAIGLFLGSRAAIGAAIEAGVTIAHRVARR